MGELTARLVVKWKARGPSTTPGEEEEDGGHRGERAAAWSGKKNSTATRFLTSSGFMVQRGRHMPTAVPSSRSYNDVDKTANFVGFFFFLLVLLTMELQIPGASLGEEERRGIGRRRQREGVGLGFGLI
jgi:hypothetical protein